MFLCGGDGCVRIWNIIPFHQQAEDQPVQKIGECVYNHDACGQGILDDRAVTSDHTKDVRKITAEEDQHDIGKTTKRSVFNRKFISKNDVAKTYHQLSFCHAGKDRTGVVSAVILKRLGFDDRTIIDDYMETKDNLMDVLMKYAEDHSEVDINTIIPREENITTVLRKAKL